MTKKFKVVSEFIKDMSSETPDIQTYLFVKDNIGKYLLNIEINSKALKDKIIEVNTTLKFSDNEQSDKKSTFEIVYVSIVEIDEDQNVLSVEEKPQKPKSNYAIVGLYFYPNSVIKIAKNVKPSERGELEIVDVINWYVDRGKATYGEVKGFWSDAGTPDSLVQANKLVSEKHRREND